MSKNEPQPVQANNEILDLKEYLRKWAGLIDAPSSPLKSSDPEHTEIIPIVSWAYIEPLAAPMLRFDFDEMGYVVYLASKSPNKHGKIPL
jgi:hypothetical protein